MSTIIEATKLVRAALEAGHVLTAAFGSGTVTAGRIPSAVAKGSPRFGCYAYGRGRFAEPAGKLVGEDYGAGTAARIFVEYAGRGGAANAARKAGECAR